MMAVELIKLMAIFVLSLVCPFIMGINHTMDHNYETELVLLYLCNTSLQILDRANQLTTARDLQDYVKSLITNHNGNSLQDDLINASLQRVNWQDVLNGVKTE
jgi:phage-related holin